MIASDCSSSRSYSLEMTFPGSEAGQVGGQSLRLGCGPVTHGLRNVSHHLPYDDGEHIFRKEVIGSLLHEGGDKLFGTFL